MSLEVVDKRKFTSDGHRLTAELDDPDSQFDTFTPTLAGFQPLFDTVLVRQLKLAQNSVLYIPDQYATPTLFGEVIASANDILPAGCIVRFFDCVGTTITFSDGKEGHRYLMIREQDIIGKWGAAS